jgi:hypothetical protein
VIEVQLRSEQVLSTLLGALGPSIEGGGHKVKILMKQICNVSMVGGKICSLTGVGVQRARDVIRVRDTESAQTEVQAGVCEKCGGRC